MPFSELDGTTPARIVLEQIGPKTFRLVESFRYVDATTGDSFLVPDPRWGDLRTDLASVPAVLQWVVPRYGQHTLPAVLHDQLIRGDLTADRERADRIFRDAMGEQGVPLARRWLMWAAVSLGTIVAERRWRIVLVALWVVVWTALAFRLTPPFAKWDVWVLNTLVRIPWWSAVLAAVVGPLVLGVVWLRRYLVGVISGYGAFLFSVPLVAILIALAVYRIVESGATVVDARRRRSGPGGEPPPASTAVRTVPDG